MRGLLSDRYHTEGIERRDPKGVRHMHQARRQHEQSVDPCKAPRSVLVVIRIWYQEPLRASVKVSSLPVQISSLP